MPEKLCRVTVVDCYGEHRSFEVTAASVNRAALAYAAYARNTASAPHGCQARGIKKAPGARVHAWDS